MTRAKQAMVVMVLAGMAGAASAQMTIPAGSFPSERAIAKGKVDRFTLSAEGQPDGFILDDGTEVHVRVYLAKQLTTAIHRGELVTVRGLRSPDRPFLAASSVTSDLNHGVVNDTGNPGPDWSLPPPVTTTSLEGTIGRQIHRVDGSVDGAFLTDGVEVRLPDGISADWPDLFKPGQTIAVTGEDVQTEFGRVIRIEMLGPSASQLSPISPGYQPPPRPMQQ